MPWILIALISPVLHGFSNIIDQYLTNTLFKNVWTLSFYSIIFNALCLPFALLIERPHLPPASLLGPLLIIGFIEVAYLFPYFKALQTEDTSVVASLFSLGKIFVPIFAYLLIGERVSLAQYAGFFIVIFSAALLTWHQNSKMRLGSAFWYMLLVSILLSAETVVYKYAFDEVGWATGFIIPSLFTLGFGLLFLLVPKIRKSIVQQARHFDGKTIPFIATAALTFAGILGETYAISLRPVLYERAVSSVQPFFVLLFAIILSRAFPRYFKEKIDSASIVKKLLLFACVVGGIYLVVQ